MSRRGAGKVVDVQLGRGGHKEQKGEDMVVDWRAAVVRTCEMGRKMDKIYVEAIISSAWEQAPTPQRVIE